MLLISLMFIGTLVLSGCGQSSQSGSQEVNSGNGQSNASNYEFQKNSAGEVDIMKEEAKLQLNKTMPKEEKNKLFEELQKINREQTKAKMGNN